MLKRKVGQQVAQVYGFSDVWRRKKSYLLHKGNEALVQNGLLFKFFMVGLGVVG